MSVLFNANYIQACSVFLSLYALFTFLIMLICVYVFLIHSFCWIFHRLCSSCKMAGRFCSFSRRWCVFSGSFPMSFDWKVSICWSLFAPQTPFHLLKIAFNLEMDHSNYSNWNGEVFHSRHGIKTKASIRCWTTLRINWHTGKKSSDKQWVERNWNEFGVVIVGGGGGSGSVGGFVSEW